MMVTRDHALRRAGQTRLFPMILLESSVFLSGFGNGIAAFALPWLVLEITGSGAALGLVSAATAVPLLLASVFGGTVVDLVGRRRSAVGSDVISAMSLMALLLVDATLGLSVAAVAALAAAGAAFDHAGISAREAMVPAVSKKARWSLEKLTSVHEALWGTSLLVSSAAGGLLVTLWGSIGAIWVALGASLLAAVFTAFLRGYEPSERSVERMTVRSIWQGTLDGFRFIAQDRLLRALIIITIPLRILFAPVQSVILPYHFNSIGQPANLGLLLVTLGGASVIGSIGYGALSKRVAGRTIFRCGIVGVGACVFCMAWLPFFGLLVTIGAILGLLFGPVGPLVNTALLVRTPDAMRARVLGVMVSATYIANPVGNLVGGSLVDGVGVPKAFLGIGAIMLLLTWTILVVRPVRELDDIDATLEVKRT